jgi:hypothetical protein
MPSDQYNPGGKTPQKPRGNVDYDSGLRAGLAYALNNIDSFEDRERYDVFGWPTTISDAGDDAPFGADEYLALYLRNAYCRTVVDKPALTSWRSDPQIIDTEGNDETDLEAAVKALEINHDIWSYAERADRIAGIGEHGLLVFGYSDTVGEEANSGVWATDARDKGLNGLDDLIQMRPVLQTQITDIDWGGPSSERWNQPEYYHIDWSDDVDDETEGENGPWKIHHSRVADIPATRLLDDETLARPRAEPVLNNIIDIEKVRGAAAEIGYRSADYGLHINYDPEKVDPEAVQDSDVGDEFNRWYNGLQPQFTTVGGEVNTLGGGIPDPTKVIEPNLDEISAQTGIPKKEFRGNESGEVSGAEADERSFYGTMESRQNQYNAPYVVRRVVDTLKDVGIVPEPDNAYYQVEWDPLREQSAQDVADVENTRAQVVAQVAPIVSGLTGDAALNYIQSGEWPELELDTEPIGNIELAPVNGTPDPLPELENYQ